MYKRTNRMEGENKNKIVVTDYIEQSIHVIRGQKVMLDMDLANLYGVETRILNQAVKRNFERFPEDFMFQLSKEELEYWKSQYVTTNKISSRSQIVILNNRGKNYKYLPYVFTEQGVAMLSSVLRSPQAIIVNIEIMRAFVRMRHLFASHEKLSKEMEEIKSFLLKNSQQNNMEFRKIWKAIDKLISRPEREGRKIGFKLN